MLSGQLPSPPSLSLSIPGFDRAELIRAIQQQHRPNRLPPVGKTPPATHLLWRLLHPRPSTDDEHALVCHQVLVPGREARVLFAARGILGCRRRFSETPAADLGAEI